MQDDLAPECLMALAQQRLHDAREKLRTRTSRLREFGDHRFLQSWLMNKVRGIP